ncbi:MAG: ArsR family transcriptional regulator [Candidatus Hodarchaeota archaeon]
MPESDFSTQDIITYRQKPFKILETLEAIKYSRDKILDRVLVLLKNRPMTLLELKEALNKSTKTIYRYLNQLKKAGLVVQAGKRIITKKNNEIETQTLYGRVAKIYYRGLAMKEIDEFLKEETTAEHFNRNMDHVALLLGQLFPNRKGDNQRLWELSKKVTTKKLEYLEKLLGNADDKTLDFISALGPIDTEYVIETVGLFAILSEKNWEKEVSDCFK